MNILLLATHLNFGGIASYVVNLAIELKRRGENVFVASSGGDLVRRLQNQGVKHINLNIKTKSELSPKMVFCFLKLKSIIKEKNIQIIHSQTRVTQVLSYFLSRFLNIPYVTTCHGYFKKRLSRKLFGCWGETAIAISEPVRKHLIDDFGVNPQKVRLVYHGVELKEKKDFSDEETRRKFGLKKDSPVIGIIARFSSVKGHRYLIEAMKYVLNIQTDAQLLIVGDGPDKEAILDLIAEAGIKDNTVLLPAQQNLEEIFSIMSVYVSPSVKEGLGLSILEAQANYVPVAAFNIGGISDIIENELTGLLVEPFDTKALAYSILRLIKDEYLALRIKKEAYRQVLERFSRKNMAENTIKVYQEALRNKTLNPKRQKM